MDKRMNVLGVTLARGGSKGIPKKNLAPINSKPLIQYTFDILPDIRRIDDYIVSTDSQDIIDYCNSQGILAPFIRPDHLSSDTATSADALIHATLFMENKMKIKYDIVVELMCTNPFKKAYHVDNAIDKLVSTKADSVIGVSLLEDHHPARIKKIENDFLIDFCVPELSSRRQDLKPNAYIRNGSIYVINRDMLINEAYRYGGSNSRPLLMEPVCLVNIDTPLDLQIASAILTQEPRK